MPGPPPASSRPAAWRARLLPPAKRPGGAQGPIVRPVIAVVVGPVIMPVMVARVPIPIAPIMVPVMVGVVPVVVAMPPVAVPPAARLGRLRPEQPGEHEDGERHNNLLHRLLRGI